MAKFMTRRNGEAEVKIDDVKAFKNGSDSGIEIEWSSAKIGFGSCTVLFEHDEEGNLRIRADSECMCDNDDKRFLHTLFDELIERTYVYG